MNNKDDSYKEISLTLLGKGKLALIERREEEDKEEAKLRSATFEKMLKLAHERFGGEFSWEFSDKGKYRIITNSNTDISLGSTTGNGLSMVKKCSICNEYIHSIEVYPHNIPLVDKDTIKFNHSCTKDREDTVDSLLIKAIEAFVIDIVESYQD